MRYEHYVVLAVVFLCFLSSPVALAQRNTNQIQKWEYKLVTCDPKAYAITIDQLGQLGEEGWELITKDEASCGYYYFRRSKRVEAKQVKKQESQQPTAQQCLVSLDNAPTIRGLQLGLGVEEIIPLVTAERK